MKIGNMDPDDIWLFVQLGNDEPVFIMSCEYASDACNLAEHSIECGIRQGSGRYIVQRKGITLFEFPF